MPDGRLFKEQAQLCAAHGGGFQCDITLQKPSVDFSSRYFGETSGKIHTAEECHIWINSRVSDPHVDARGLLIEANRNLHEAGLSVWGFHRHRVGPGLINTHDRLPPRIRL